MNRDISIAVIMLHPSCNMVCSFCVTEDVLSAFSFEEAVALLDTLRNTSINNVVFGGGEPFTWQHDLIALTEEAKQRGYFVQIGTNGINLPENYQSLESVDRYVLPLESVDEQIHNTMRIYQNEHHGIVMKRLQELKEAAKSVTVSTVVTQDNIKGLKELGFFLKAYNAASKTLHAWHLYKFLPEGRGGRPNAERLSISTQAFDQSVAELNQLNLGFAVYKRKNMFQSKTVGFFWCEGDELRST